MECPHVGREADIPSQWREYSRYKCIIINACQYVNSLLFIHDLSLNFKHDLSKLSLDHSSPLWGLILRPRGQSSFTCKGQGKWIIRHSFNITTHNLLYQSPFVPRLRAYVVSSTNPFNIRSSEPDIYTTFSFLLFDRNIEYDGLVNAKTRKLWRRSC